MDYFVKRLMVKNFSVFHRAEFEFVPGINVLIGENGVGKSHVLKLLYSMLKPFDDNQTLPNEHPSEMKNRFNNKLLGVFRPEDRQPGRLSSDLNGKHISIVRLDYNKQLFVEFEITVDGKLRPLRRSLKATPTAVFIPPRDVLAIYEGFASAYEHRELAFDETYYDLCKSLSTTPLKGESKKKIRNLLSSLETILGGKLKRRGPRFYLEQEGRRDIEAHLMAEGFRKVATLYRLIANGTLGPGAILLLDEPEAGLNPRLTSRMVEALRELAHLGVQIVLSTHDFLLTQELSLAAEYGTSPMVDIRFFALSRKDDGTGVVIQPADALAELEGNPILLEFAAHYDKEQALVQHRLKKKG